MDRRPHFRRPLTQRFGELGLPLAATAIPDRKPDACCSSQEQQRERRCDEHHVGAADGRAGHPDLPFAHVEVRPPRSRSPSSHATITVSSGPQPPVRYRGPVGNRIGSRRGVNAASAGWLQTQRRAKLEAGTNEKVGSPRGVSRVFSDMPAPTRGAIESGPSVCLAMLIAVEMGPRPDGRRSSPSPPS